MKSWFRVSGAHQSSLLVHTSGHVDTLGGEQFRSYLNAVALQDSYAFAH